MFSLLGCTYGKRISRFITLNDFSRGVGHKRIYVCNFNLCLNEYFFISKII